MKFFSRQTSEKMQKLGCVSENGLWFIEDDLISYAPQFLGKDPFGITYQKAFTPFDLCGPSEMARENAKILWGDFLVCKNCGAPDCDHHSLCVKSFNYYRHELIDLPEDEVEAYILKTMKEAQ